MFKILVTCLFLHFCGQSVAVFTFRRGTDRLRNAEEKQEFLINTLDEFDISYPTEVDHRGQVTDHVTTLSRNRRRRRRAAEETGPIIYQVKYKGKLIKLVLHLNDKLFGSDLVIEWHRENGTIDRKPPTDNCYLVGETEPFHSSVAISDCDGLAGIIDLGEDSLYIEPVLNRSLVINRGWTGPGRPHLMYKKAALHRSESRGLDFSEKGMQDYPKGLRAEEVTSDIKVARAESSYVLFVNHARRGIKLYYIEDGQEKTFKVLLDRQTQGVNTFTSHKWLARDMDTKTQLWINKRKLYIPPTGNSHRRRSNAYITVPRNLRLPPPTKVNKPNSHITFINRTPRFVKLYYVEDGETIFFHNIAPGADLAVNTYTSHRWFAKDLDTEKLFHVNGRNEYSPVKAGTDDRVRAVISIPSTLRLPELKLPDMLKVKPKYIEVMVTADSSVVQYHGKEKSEKYILTLMNIVSRLFQHKSIGAPIYFVVVRVVLLEKDPKEIKITAKPMASLTSVCYWGHKMRKGLDRLTKDFYDQTVFLTRKDFGPSGYAPVHGMCYRVRSCTLNQEDGFTSSFIVAHETGHTLGLEHDGVNNNCSNDVIKGSIMAPLVRSRFDRFFWSPCSRRDLISKLKSLWCLDDVPFRNTIPYLDKLPGQIYTVDDQCRHSFGRNSRFCSSMKRVACVELWCTQVSYRFNRGFCQTRRTAALEGTKCAENKWCRLGKCVPVNEENFGIPLPRPTEKPIHGGWGEWSVFSECSRTCGGGVHHKERECNNPVPKHNGRPCEGAHVEYELCNTMDCPGQLLTFEETRDEQCRRLSPSLRPGGKGVWSSYDILNVKIDCDFETDFCGWANDTNNNFHWKRHVGRTPTAGTGPSKDHTIGTKGHYIFLETSRPVYEGWKARIMSKYIGMRIACLKFWYHAYGGNNHMGELQLIVKTELGEQKVWSVDQNRGDRWVLKYATILSKKPYKVIFQGIRGHGYLSDFALDDISLSSGPCVMALKHTTFIDNEMKLNPCQAFCQLSDGGGSSIDTLEIDLENGTRCYNSLSSFDVCIGRKCESVGCDGAVGSNKVLDSCGVCGGTNGSCAPAQGSINTLPTEDLQILMECPVGATNIVLEDLSPNFLVLGAMGADNSSFNSAEEKSSSVMYELAGAKFVYKRDGDREEVSTLGPIKDRIVVKVKFAEEPVPITLRYQYYKPRDNGTRYYWSHFEWSDCSKTCGEGIRTRSFKCKKQGPDTEAPEVNCLSSSKPAPLTKSCNLTACERYQWKTFQWSKCSEDCEGGNQTRQVECRGVLGGHVVNNSLCSTEKPETKKRCNDEPCPADWVVGNWSKCSRTCGNGVQSRTVTCQSLRGAKSLNCPSASKPGSKFVCRNKPCKGDGPSALQNMSCSFEEGFCGWSNVRNSKLDQFDWLLRNGSTPSRNTGPSKDHTFGTSKGVYAYIEASDPQQRNDRARLLSPTISSRRICLDFWYHMYGVSMGWLRVFVRNPNARDRRLWHKSGNQGNEWINERISIYSYLPYQIIIEGIRGKGYASDVALDDVKITSGGCPAFDEPKNQCKADKSRYCKAASRLNWCTSKRWGSICCKTCQKSV